MAVEKVGLKPVPPEDARFLSVLIRAYLMEAAPGAQLDPVHVVDRIWSEKGRYGLWITHGVKRVGFALVRDTLTGKRELSEFAILGAYRRRHIGRQAVHMLVNDLPGSWYLGVSLASRAAQDFWPSVLADCPNIRNLRRGSPQNHHQTQTLHFDIDEETGHDSGIGHPDQGRTGDDRGAVEA
ncbi:hypothetical protein [Chachezhania sediminis]|uniref:hypothetical protein n=1 Tax=Chachezhania sediminis TaxID=2599291 RepID=UPI00131E783D|nr:hypothetical protein [Chachezhania sediminis]